MCDPFVEANKRGRIKEVISPSGKYCLAISYYAMGEGYWDYSRGLLEEISSHEIVADIKRNYADFWHCFVAHPNGSEYLLCGEDYQGYTVINCNTGKRNDYLHENAKKGWGFCWADCESIDSGSRLKVMGCYWGAPFEIVVYDFSNPETLPLPEISREYETGEDDGDE